MFLVVCVLSKPWLTIAYMCRYGGYSGTGWGHGVRNVVFRSPKPSVGPETWIRMEDGETHARIILDSSYN